MTSESKSTQKQKPEQIGQKYTECKYCGAMPDPPRWDKKREIWVHAKECNVCRNFKVRHGFHLTREDRAKLGEPKCAICGTNQRLRVDHDHTTNTVRGWLCDNHNKALGLFRDNPEHMLKAIEYLNVQQEKQG